MIDGEVLQRRGGRNDGARWQGKWGWGCANPLTTTAGYAQQLAASRDPELARHLAAGSAAEAAHLDRTIGGFLAGARAARAGSKALVDYVDPACDCWRRRD